MNIIVKSSVIQFRNQQVGQPTRSVEEHYNGRRITAMVNGEEEMFRFKKDELAFYVDEAEMIEAIEERVIEKVGKK